MFFFHSINKASKGHVVGFEAITFFDVRLLVSGMIRIENGLQALGRLHRMGQRPVETLEMHMKLEDGTGALWPRAHDADDIVITKFHPKRSFANPFTQREVSRLVTFLSRMMAM